MNNISVTNEIKNTQTEYYKAELNKIDKEIKLIKECIKRTKSWNEKNS